MRYFIVQLTIRLFFL